MPSLAEKRSADLFPVNAEPHARSSLRWTNNLGLPG